MARADNERLALGKPSHGSLSLKAKVEGETLSFEITDDGRGIDWGSIADKAWRGAYPMPHRQTSWRRCVQMASRLEAAPAISRGEASHGLFQRAGYERFKAESKCAPPRAWARVGSCVFGGH